MVYVNNKTNASGQTVKTITVNSFDDYNNITQKVHTEIDTTKNSTVVSTYDKIRLSTQTENGGKKNPTEEYQKHGYTKFKGYFYVKK